MRIRVIILVIAVLLFGAVITVPQIIEAKRSNTLATTTAPVQGRKQEVTVGESIRNDTSPPLREMPQKPVFKPKREANENPKVPHFHKDTPDRVVQKTIAADEFTAANMPTADMNFNGMAFPGVACNCAPPDTNGEVGATQYVQSVNEGFQVFDKTTGASLLGPSGAASAAFVSLMAAVIRWCFTISWRIAGSSRSSPAFRCRPMSVWLFPLLATPPVPIIVTTFISAQTSSTTRT
jgi:hypothetical protein